MLEQHGRFGDLERQPLLGSEEVGDRQDRHLRRHTTHEVACRQPRVAGDAGGDDRSDLGEGCRDAEQERADEDPPHARRLRQGVCVPAELGAGDPHRNSGDSEQPEVQPGLHLLLVIRVRGSSGASASGVPARRRSAMSCDCSHEVRPEATRERHPTANRQHPVPRRSTSRVASCGDGRASGLLGPGDAQRAQGIGIRHSDGLLSPLGVGVNCIWQMPFYPKAAEGLARRGPLMPPLEPPKPGAALTAAGAHRLTAVRRGRSGSCRVLRVGRRSGERTLRGRLELAARADARCGAVAGRVNLPAASGMGYAVAAGTVADR